mgnify:CR=1 FL=1|tara:strand:- start:5294 stop:6430 length:1137 start_codon:yes stop_codon:yes gene_type:complete
MKRIVIKIGSQIILNDAQDNNYNHLNELLSEIVNLRSKGFEFTIVTSGAVALAKHHLLIKGLENSNQTSSKQAMASIGQTFLMEKYSKFFESHNIYCAQVLAGRDNFNSRIAYLNIKNTLEKLYELNVIPIINENDVVSTKEIEGRFYGDNDRLSSVVANAIDADLLILFGRMDGLYTENPDINGKGVLIKKIDVIDETIMSYAKDSEDKVGSGGMKSKLEAAKICMGSGIKCVITSPQNNVINKIIEGNSIGTQFVPNSSNLESKKRWLFTGVSENKGMIIIDDGAKKALLTKGASLLPVGILSIEGKFNRGDILLIKDSKNNEIAYGITNYGAEDSLKLKGKDSNEIDEIIEINYGTEMIHRDNLVLLESTSENKL